MTGMTTRRLWVCAGAAGLLISASEARAVDRTWFNNAPGTLIFQTDTNWNPVGQPTLSDNLTFAIDLAGNPILIGATSQAFDMDFAFNDWELSGAAGGTMDSNGTLTIDYGFGTSLGDAVNVLVSNDLTWNNAGNIFVGKEGSGTLTIQDNSNLDGLQVFVGDGPEGLGVVTVTGQDSSLTGRLLDNTGVFTIGRGGGTGTVNVLDGAELRTNSTAGNDIWVGGHTDDDATATIINSIGTLNVSGAGSFVETEDLNIGIFGGTGFLNITDGGNVTLTDGGSPDASFGGNGVNGAVGQGIGLVDGDGSLLSARNILVASSGLGALTVSGGGVVGTRIDSSTPSDIFIGSSTGSAGKAAVYGFATDGTTASLMDSEDNLYVGNAGLGVLNIGLDLADNPVGSGALQVDLSLVIGDDDGNDGDNTMRVHGVDTTANVGLNLVVGNLGRGLFEATGGATITVGNDLSVGIGNGSNSIALIDGLGTTLTADNLFAGNGSGGGSTAAMTVSGGAVVTFTDPTPTDTTPDVGTITLGDDGAGQGTLTMIGAGSIVQTTDANGQWFIGGSGNEPGGTGTVNVFAGGQGIAGGRTVLGWNTDAQGTLNVDGVGSVFDANGDYILVGFRGNGDMNITGGGVVNTNRMFVADATGSAGSTLNVDGLDSELNIVGRFHVGDSATGFANVTNGGQINIGIAPDNLRFIIGSGTSSDGSKLRIDGAGSRVDYADNLDIAVGNAGGSTTNRATLEVTNGGVLSAPQARIILGDITSGNGHVIVDGPGSRVQAAIMYVGDGDSNSSGLLDITNGGVVELSGDFQGGSFGSGQGTINIDGPGSQLLVGTTLSLGDDTLGGATNGAAGTMNLSDGGHASNAGQAYIGHFTGSFGTATLGSTTANDSVWDIGGELILAGTETSSQGSGFGVLNANTGGVVNIASNLRIRNLGDVNLSGGTINIGGDLDLVDAGSTINFAFGKLAFTDPVGKTFSPTELGRILALGGASRPTLYTNMELAVTGTAVIGGPLRLLGGTLSAGALTPASFQQLDFDAGTLNLTASDLSIKDTGPMGNDVTIGAGQTLNVTQKVSVFNGSTLTVVGNFSAGTLATNGDVIFVDSQPGAKVIDGIIDVLSVGTLTLVGDIQFNGPVNGASEFFGPGNAIFAGAFAPGNSAGQVAFDGGLGVTPQGSIEIELGGTTPGTAYDQLVVTADASLAGVLDLALIDGFFPSLGDAFTVLTSAGLNGTTFDSITGSAIGAGLQLDVTYTTTDVIINVVDAAAPGDFDGDGDIDDSDLGTAFANYTGPVGAAGNKTPAQGDTDGDGDVDDSDLGTAFAGYTGPLSPASVPEPGSLVILAGLLGLTRRRRR